jgi:hypothetical protein
MPQVRWGAVGAVAVLALAGVTEQAGASKMPARQRGMSERQIERVARNAHLRVIVVLKAQHHGKLATAASVKARAAAQRRERAPVIARISGAGGAVTRQYTTLDGFVATVSPATQAALQADPSVAAVIPDSTVSVPATGSGQVGANPMSPVSPNPGNPSTPYTTVCPSDPAKPLLEPEALQTMHVAYTDPTVPQAQSLATGKGVKVAFFGEGIDVNNPDFIRADGSHVITDYKDFSGAGPDAASPGAEAFGDASSIAAQGRQVYDLSTYVNPAHPLPAGCNITVRGVAPDASLIAMKVFSTGGAQLSVIVQALDYAVTVDHADILSESIGGTKLPEYAADVLRDFNDAAVAAGVTVSTSAGDAGANAPAGGQSDDDKVIANGATTTHREIAQTTATGYQFAQGTYLSDNISPIGNAGFSQNAQIVDVVSPGDGGWALCTPNPALYTRCVDLKGAPASLLMFSGTSESAPLTAGTAALIIEAYRNAHGGQTPSPATVKNILQSTANDLGAPAVEQGAGEVDALKAVQEATSIDGGTPTGHGLRVSPAKLNFTGKVGSQAGQTVTVTNTGATEQVIAAHARALTDTLSDQRQDVTIAATPTFVDGAGGARPYVTTTFTVPQGADRLVADAAWAGGTSRVGMALIDPVGSYATYSLPQGNGDHGQVDVRKPTAGTWTALVYLRDGTNPGTVHLEFSSQHYQDVDQVSPLSLTLAPGHSGDFHVNVGFDQAGDGAHDLVISNTTDGEQSIVPIVLRGLVPIDPQNGGTFTGTLVGGNGRETRAEEQTFAFDVPEHRKNLTVKLAFNSPGTEVIGTLVDPNGNSPGSADSGFLSVNSSTTVLYPGLVASATDPVPGRWKFVVTVRSPVGGTVLTGPFTGTISFAPRPITATGIPDGGTLPAGQPVTAILTITNDGPNAEEMFIDPRTNDMGTFALSAVTAASFTINGGSEGFGVPTHTDSVLGVASSSKPIVFEMQHSVLGGGDPSVTGVNTGNAGAGSYAAPDVGNGEWVVIPSLKGPFTAPTTATATAGMSVHTRGFDLNVQAPTGKIGWGWIDFSEPFDPLGIAPGQTGTIPVTFTPEGAPGTTVTGVLYVEDFNRKIYTANEQIGIPYRYTIAGDGTSGPDSTSVQDNTSVHGTVPSILSLKLGDNGQVSLGTFTPGSDTTYKASTTADVTTTTGDATLAASVAGNLANGAFKLADPLGVALSKSTWDGPATHDLVAIDLAQHIGATEKLRSGSYSTVVTFTLSTTEP